MFHTYKILGSLAEPMNLYAVLLLAFALLAVLGWERGRSIGRAGCFLLAVALFALTLVPLGQWSMLPLENRYPNPDLPAKVDGILVLTGDESPFLSEARGIPIAGNAGQRHMYLARLAKRYPKARLVVVGNTGAFHDSAKFSTQSIVKELHDGIGIPRDRVEFEAHSRTTHENAVMAKAFVKPQEGQTWLLLTSAFHMPRSVLCFEKEGWKVVPVPTDYFTYPKPQKPHSLQLAHQIRLLSMAAHEYVGLISYWFAGWIETPWR